MRGRRRPPIMARMSSLRTPGDRLTPLDATFLELEEVDATAHMHIGSLMVFEARPGLPPTLERLARHLESRLGVLAALRLPAVGAAHGRPALAGLGARPGLRHPRPRRARRASRPGRGAELLDWAGGLLVRAARPRAAAVGRAGWSPGSPAAAGPWRPRPTMRWWTAWAPPTWRTSSSIRRAGRGRSRRRVPESPASPASPGPLGLLGGAVRGGLYTARHPGRLRDAFLQAKAIADVVVHDEIVSAPHSSLNVPLSPAAATGSSAPIWTS